MRGDVAQLEEHLLCKQWVVGSSPIISTIRYPKYMDKKDLEKLSVSELLKLKESINDEIEKKRTQQTLSSANRKGLSLVWIAVAIAIAAFRYFSS